MPSNYSLIPIIFRRNYRNSAKKIRELKILTYTFVQATNSKHSKKQNRTTLYMEAVIRRNMLRKKDLLRAQFTEDILLNFIIISKTTTSQKVPVPVISQFFKTCSTFSMTYNLSNDQCTIQIHNAEATGYISQ